MLGKVLSIIFSLFFLVYAIHMAWTFIANTIKHRRRMRKLDEWTNFHKQLTHWATEILDKKIKDQFMSECLADIVNIKISDVERFDQFDWHKEKMKVYQKWGQYIPSLLQEVRQEKLNKLV